MAAIRSAALPPDRPGPTACLALADGSVFYGHGFGATGTAQAELCFNTAMTGYQEIMTDPSYAGQIVTFTFPHIGNTGTTPEDDETTDPVAAGMVVKWNPDRAVQLAGGRGPCDMAEKAGADRHRRHRYPPPDPRHPQPGRAPCRARP